MNSRERFTETMTFGTPDRMPIWECAFWGETLTRWREEGMPRLSGETGLCEYFGYDRSFGIYFRDTIRIKTGMCPAFTRTVLSEEDGIITEQGEDGVVFRWSRGGHSTKQFVRFPVETREDFRALKARFDPDAPDRFRPGWLERAAGLQAEGAPVCIDAGGYYGFARDLMGLENLSYALCDDIGLIEEIFEFRTEYICRILEKALTQIKPDFAEFWEDMAYKTGPLISPELFRKLALKHYRTVTGLLNKHGVKIILLDSDGNIDDLIPIWLDGGITGIWPMEAAAGMDPVALRRKYGRSLGIIGGIDKRVLASDKSAIRDEVMSKVPFLTQSGGYIPTCDHAVPPDVSFENYKYYISLLHEIAGIV